MSLLANSPLVTDMISSIINKEEQFSTTHIYKHSKFPNKNESDEIKLVCRISSNLLELDWYDMREEPNNTMNTMMNTSMSTMNNVTYY
jgi:flavodoxin